MNNIAVANETFKNTLDGQLQKVENQLPTTINVELLKVQYYNHFSKEMEKNPKLAMSIQNAPNEFAAMTLNAIALGLQPKEEFNIIPFSGELKPHVDYKALYKLMLKYSSRPIKSIKSVVVHENDELDTDGTTYINHKFDPFASNKTRGKVTGVYARVLMENDVEELHFISMEEILKVRECSAGATSKSSPWQRFPEAMYIKTLMRKIAKWYPLELETPYQYESKSLLDDLDSPFTDTKVKISSTEKPKPKKAEAEVIEAEEVKVEAEKDYRNELINFCSDKKIDMTEVAKQYKLNAKSTNRDFGLALNNLSQKYTY